MESINLTDLKHMLLSKDEANGHSLMKLLLNGQDRDRDNKRRGLPSSSRTTGHSSHKRPYEPAYHSQSSKRNEDFTVHAGPMPIPMPRNRNAQWNTDIHSSSSSRSPSRSRPLMKHTSASGLNELSNSLWALSKSNNPESRRHSDDSEEDGDHDNDNDNEEGTLRRSFSVPIPIHSVVTYDNGLEELEERAKYERATWRMYYRITSHRMRNQNPMDGDSTDQDRVHGHGHDHAHLQDYPHYIPIEGEDGVSPSGSKLSGPFGLDI